MKRKITRLLLALVMVITIFAVASAAALAATTWTVDDDGPADFSTIQGAINAATSGDTVQVAAGTYYENITLKSGVIVQGAGASVTTIDGGGSGSVVTAISVDSAARLDGFTITNGSTVWYGGGIYASYSSPTISNSVIAGNYGYKGGGIYASYSSLTISNNIITGNNARYGGGIYVAFASPTVSNSTITGNSAQRGGGIYAPFVSPTVSNSIITGNSASDFGGGILASSSATIVYSDVWGNSPDNYFFGCSPGAGSISLDPLFVDAASGDYHLQSTSPAIDTGDNAAVPSWLTTDFEGDPRIWDGDGDTVAVVDMGADEYYVALVPATIDIDPDTLNLKSKGKWITAYIELPGGYDVVDIDATTVLLNGIVSAVTDPKYGFVTDPGEYLTDNDGDGILERMVKFDRSAVQGILAVGDAVAITVTGEVAGTQFEGSDTIRVK